MSGRISNTICPTIKENNKYDEVKEKILRNSLNRLDVFVIYMHLQQTNKQLYKKN